MFTIVFFEVLAVAMLTNLSFGFLRGEMWCQTRFIQRDHPYFVPLIFSQLLALVVFVFAIWSTLERTSSGQ